MMQESESRAFAESVIRDFVGKTPVEITLLSSGCGPAGWSQNRIWKAIFSAGISDALVLKLGDGPMSGLVVREIDLVEYVLPAAHPNLPVIHAVSRRPIPYILMEYLAPVPLQANLADTPRTLLHELAEALLSILSAHKTGRLIAELPRKKEIPGITSTFSYGNLNLRNIGKRTDGTLVIFDWDAARIAPLGADFKLFQKHAAFLEVMSAFHSRCHGQNFTLPPLDRWHQQLVEMWTEEDNGES